MEEVRVVWLIYLAGDGIDLAKPTVTREATHRREGIKAAGHIE
jgi:hypothetical protein